MDIYLACATDTVTWEARAKLAWEIGEPCYICGYNAQGDNEIIVAINAEDKLMPFFEQGVTLTPIVHRKCLSPEALALAEQYIEDEPQNHLGSKSMQLLLTNLAALAPKPELKVPI